MSIVLLGATSGSVTLQEPAVAGTTVIDLPATSGTMAVTSGSPSFTNITATGTLAVNGNTTLGDATTDTLTVGVTGIVKDASGNVGIGTASPTAKVQIFTNGAPASSGNMTTGMAVASAAGSFAINIGADATAQYTWLNSAYINSSNTASPMVFMTGATERMRIDSSGNVTIANGIIQTTATADATVGFQLIKVSATVTAGTNKYIQFLTNNGAASTGFIASNGASNAGFFAGSDRRIKTDIQAVADGVEKVMQLKPSKFKFKENDEPSHGFIAQELDEVFPECVYKPNDGEGSELQEGQEPWAVNLDKLIPYLTAAIQEQQAIITQLQADVVALKGA